MGVLNDKMCKTKEFNKNDYVIIVLFFLIIKQSNNQTIKQSNNQTIKQSNNQTIKQSINQTNNKTIKQ